MDGLSIFILLVVAAFAAILIYGYCVAEPYKPGEPRHRPSGDELIVCPHCQTRGHVTSRQVRLKRGISGGKATAALLTGGVSTLATGLSRKERSTEAKCSRCGSTWHF